MRVRSSIAGRSALIDTSAFYALADRHSAIFPVAQGIRARLTTERRALFTTNFIVAETHALILARRNRVDAARFLRQVDASPTTIVRVEEADERRAREIVYQYTDKDFSLTDAASFAVMERLGIGSAFTFDRHFAQYGFAVLGPDAIT